MGEARRRMERGRRVAEAIVRWKEVNKVMEIKIIFLSGLTVIGVYREGTGPYNVGIMDKPRALALGTDPQNRQVVALQNLIGEPEEIEIIAPSLMYDVKNEQLINLYIQATTGIIVPEGPTNVRPIRSGSN